MKNIYKILAAIVTVATILSGCATNGEPSMAYRGETPQQIFAKGKEALQDKGYTEAIKRFEALDVQYPYSAETDTAQLYLIYAYYMKEDYALAASAADRYVRIHPTSPNVDYAYFMRGLSDYYQNLGVIERFFKIDLATRDLTQVQKSYADFNELVTKFPNSKYSGTAHQYLIYLRNLLANHELDVANYYYQRKAYVAAANRASDVVQHFQGAPAVPNALVVMAKSYNKLRLEKEYQDTMTLLKYNFPNQTVDLST